MLEPGADGSLGEERIRAGRGFKYSGRKGDGRWEFGLGDGQQLIGGQIFQHLHLTLRPANGEFFNHRLVAQAEVDERGLARSNATLGEKLAHLRAGSGCNA